MSVQTQRGVSDFWRRLLAALTAVIVLLSGAPVAMAGMFMGLGTDPSNNRGSDAFGVSADGSTVVGLIYVGGGAEGFRWTSTTGMERLGHLAGGNGFDVAYAVSGDGSVVVGYGGGRAFEWTQATGIAALPDTSSYTPTAAYAVSADGTAVAGYVSLGSGDFSAFGPSGILGSGFANGISGDGSIVVGETSGEAFRWVQATGMEELGNGGANAISENGSTIVGYEFPTSNSYLAFRWSASTGMSNLGVLPGNDRSEAYAVSGDGSVVVGRTFTSSGFDEHAFIWDTAHGLRNIEDVLIGDGLNLTGWQLTEATGISADGVTIAGNGIDPHGEREAWVARLDATVPEPPAMTIWLCAGVVGICCGTMRRLLYARTCAVDCAQAG